MNIIKIVVGTGILLNFVGLVFASDNSKKRHLRVSDWVTNINHQTCGPALYYYETRLEILDTDTVDSLIKRFKKDRNYLEDYSVTILNAGVPLKDDHIIGNLASSLYVTVKCKS